MKLLVRMLTIASVLAAVASPLAAQGINGNWIAEFHRSVRSENGDVTTGDKAKARLVLQQKGDSVTGTFQVVDGPAGPGGSAPTVREVRGTIAGNKVSLQTEAEARRSMNGEESVHKVTVIYDLILDADKLDGTMIAKSANMTMPARPFSARREKP
jgi:hypothetical protein